MSAPRSRRRRLVPAAASVLTSTAVAVLPAATGYAATSGFHGVNWTDPRDNFTDDAVVPSGLSTADSYTTTKAKAGRILDGFRTDLGQFKAQLANEVGAYASRTILDEWGAPMTDATGGATADGTRIITYTCSGAGNQQRILVGSQLRNGRSGTCLDVPASNSADGTQVSIYSCNNGANQRWALAA